MVDKSDLIIILPKHGWMFPYIKDLGYHIISPYYGQSDFLRLVRKIFFKLNILGKRIWYNRVNIYKFKYIIMFEPLIISDYIQWMHKKNEDSRLFLIYANPVAVSVSPKTIDRSIIELWTGDKKDALKYGMKLYTGGSYFPQWKVKKETPIYDVFYVGKDKGRLKKLKQIEKNMNEQGLITFFYITWERGFQRKNDGIHKKFLPYENVLEYIGKSRAILHLHDGAQDGITIRIQESLIHKIKLITDDKEIIHYDFYNSNNIFILGKDKMENLKKFLDTPYIDVESTFFKHAYFENMIEEILDT